MKRIIAVFMAIAAMQALADTNDEKIVRYRREQLRETGGWLEKPDPGNGFIAIVNRQKKVDPATLEAVAKYFSECCAFRITVISDEDRRGTFNVEVVDREKSSRMMSIYPEARLAVVNVAALAAGNSNQLALRVRQETARAIAWLCGAGGSQYPGTLVSCISSPRELDRFEDEGLPPDVFLRMNSYLPKVGVRPVIKLTYREACEQGWAPEPKTIWQKKVWDKVHTPPSKPIKITYDKDKQKPVVK